MLRRVVNNVSLSGKLNQYLEPHGLLDYMLDNLVEVIVRRELGDSIVAQKIIALLGHNAIAPKALLPRVIDKGKRSNPKIRLACKAGRKRLRCLHKSQRRWMFTEKDLDRLRRRSVWTAGSHSFQKLQKLVTVLRRKSIRGMADNVRMHVLCKIEANRQSARISLGRVVGDLRDAGGV